MRVTPTSLPDFGTQIAYRNVQEAHMSNNHFAEQDDERMANNRASPQPTGLGDGVDASAREAILRALRGLKFGNVNIVVQDGVIVQIERTEKLRLRQSV